MKEAGAFVKALADILADLPAIVADEWPVFEAQLVIRLRAIESASGEIVEREFDQLLKLFDPFPDARTRLLQAYAANVRQHERASASGSPVSGSVPYRRYVDIPVFYATDREPTSQGLAPFFNGERGELSFGVVNVSIPDDHRTGRVEKPRWWKLQFRENREEHVIILGLERLEREEFAARARQTLAGGKAPDGLVFVHGYNVDFDEAARRAAQIAYDLQFHGLAMMFSWPSEGATLRYPVDKTNAIWAVPHFRDFLTLALTELGAAKVHAIAHSMGAEVLANALAEYDIGKLPESAATLSQVILAAADVDAGHFRNIAARFSAAAGRATLYSSSNDKALILSQQLQKYPRAGQAGANVVVVDHVDTIDASKLDTGLVGHSYIGDRATILSDVYNLIRHGAQPSDRFGLLAMDHADGRFWVFLPQG